jgi:hypothetical protein
MAVNDTNESTQNQTQMGAAFEQAARTGNTDRRQADKRGTPQEQAGTFSFRTLGRMGRAAMGRTPASEALSKLNKALATVIGENADKSFDITLLPIDMNQTTQLNVSTLVMAVRDKQFPEVGVAYHTLIVEASIDPQVPRQDNVNGQTIEVQRVTGDAYDQTMISVVQEAVLRHFGQVQILNADAEVVPRSFKTDDPAAVYELAANALFACTQELETHNGGFVDLNLANAQHDSNLNVRVTYGNPETADAVGQPIRSDIKIEFSAAPAQTNNQQVERTSAVAQVSGFLDLVYDPAQPQQQMGGWTQQAPSFQRYAARFVATQLESRDLLTIPAQLLALLPALTLRENNQWVQAFRNTGFGGDDLHDIGAVNIEANMDNNPSGYGARIDTKSDAFKVEHLHKLVAATVKPGLILSLDVPECGTSTWYNGVFAAAAAGNARANQAIIDAANQLTNGAFGKYFQGGRVAIDEDNRIHLGTFADRTGVRKDIREIDYLAVANLVGEKDPQVIRDWSDTFLRTGYDQRLRLHARLRIIRALFADVEITGFARRVTFEAGFIEALAKGAQEAGLVIRSTTPYADMGAFERATGAFMHSAMMGSDSTGLFNRGSFGQQAGGWGGNRGFGQRW